MPPIDPNSERLRRLESVTDATLSRLDASDLLDELLDRVRDLLDADTAAILLLDQHARQLVATAAKGLEDEVRRGFRVSVGQGFAGRVAATCEPLAITDVKPSDVVNPILVAKGVRALLGVPIFAAGELIGVLHVGRLTPREFTADDVHLLQLAADRAGIAGQIRSQRLERSAALAVQRSLLPARLPESAGVEFAARYVPGHDFGIGGDWYDVFPLTGDRLGLVIGDVAGHGLASAVVMGRVRSALRAYALVSDDPSDVLGLLDRKVHHFEAGNLTTALYAVLAPDRSSVRLSSAGHLAPVLAVPGCPPAMLEIPVDPPLGIGQPLRPRRATTVDLPAGAVLVCYTDGLVERRDEVIDRGIARLAATIGPGGADDVCSTIMRTVEEDRPTDDVAFLVARRL